MNLTIKIRRSLLNGLLVALLLISPALAQNFRLLPPPKLQFFDVNGKPLAGGHVYTYIAGTTTPFPTFTDSTGLIQNANPTVLDSGGYASIWLGLGSYKIEVTDAGDVPQYTVDNVSLASISQSPFVSDSVDVATAGIVRLGSADTICWRNNASNADVCLSKDTTDKIKFPNGLVVDSGGLTVTSGITNTNSLTASGLITASAKLKVNGGITNNGTGLQHKRFGPTCSTAAIAFAGCTGTFSWVPPFADSNYTVNCTATGGSGFPIFYLLSRSAGFIGYQVIAMNAQVALASEVDCIAVHD